MDPITVKVQSSCGGVENLKIEGATFQAPRPTTAWRELLPADAVSWLNSLGGALLRAVGAGTLFTPGNLCLGNLSTEDPKDCTPNLQASVSSLYFGEVAVYSSATEYFSITNYGECETNVSLSSPYGYSVSPSAALIPSNSSESISVTFSPSQAQDYSGYINSNRSLSVYVNGQGKDPDQRN